MSTFNNSPSATIPNLTGLLIHHRRFLLHNIIGRGAWGVVYLASRVGEPGVKYAVKAISTYNGDPKLLANLAREVAFQKGASKVSDNVLRYIDSSEDEELGILFIITEYCPDGDLLDMILTEKYVGNDDLIRNVFVQILDAVQACHDMYIFHRDLKPENILCKDGGETVVLADFGFATNLTVTKDFNMGSEPFMSPEIRGGLIVQLPSCSSPHGDIWALGVILMNLSVGSLPWQKASLKDKYFKAFLRDPDFLYKTFPISRGVNDVLKRIFNCDPTRRITIKELRERVLNIDRFTTSREVHRAAPAPPRPRAPVAPVKIRSTPLEKVQKATHAFEYAVRKLARMNSKATIAIPRVEEDIKATIVDNTTPINNITNTVLSSGVAVGTPSTLVDEFEHVASSGTSSATLSEEQPSHQIVHAIPPGQSEDRDDEESETESEGPITPETFPADHSSPAIVALEEIPILTALGSAEAQVTPVLVADTMKPEIVATTSPPAAHIKPDHPTIDLSLLTPTSRFGFGSAERNYVPQPLPMTTPPEIRARIPIASCIMPTRKGETPVRGVGVPFAYRAMRLAKESVKARALERALAAEPAINRQKREEAAQQSQAPQVRYFLTAAKKLRISGM